MAAVENERGSQMGYPPILRAFAAVRLHSTDDLAGASVSELLALHGSSSKVTRVLEEVLES